MEGVDFSNATYFLPPPLPPSRIPIRQEGGIILDGKDIGSRMKEKRTAMALTQQEFSRRCGISSSYYSSIENGRNSPSLELLTTIAKQLGVSLVYLLDDKVEETEKRVSKEIERLNGLFKDLPRAQIQLAEGLIIQAARLRILLDDNWKDILENGEYEKFSQSENQIPYDRKRPIVENYDNRDKTYQSIIHQLNGMLPGGSVRDKKSRLLGR